MEGIDACLRHEPRRETRNNKALRPNRLAERELRVNRFRVFYDIDEGAAWVKIEAIGHKRGNRLYVRGREFQLRKRSRFRAGPGAFMRCSSGRDERTSF